MEVTAGTQQRDDVARVSGRTYIMDLRKNSSSTNRFVPPFDRVGNTLRPGVCSVVIDPSFRIA
jgi:hypothetical protein